MARSKPSAPLTFDLPGVLVEKIKSARRWHGLKTASEVVRLALSRFDLEAYKNPQDSHAQISVRISGRERARLRRFARKKGASIGELMRAALEALPARPTRSPARPRTS